MSATQQGAVVSAYVSVLPLKVKKFIMREIDDKPWMGNKPDYRRLSDVVERWFDLYGKTLANGPIIYQKFQHMIEAMGNPLADQFNSKIYADFRAKRMSGLLPFVSVRWNKSAPSGATLNSELARFKAVFGKLKELGEWN